MIRSCSISYTDPEFRQYSPSTIAVAALLFTTGQNADDERLSKEMVKRCYSFLQKHFEKISDSSESNVRDDKGSDDSDECCGGKFQCLVRHDKEFQRKKRTCTPYRPNND
nr:cyclin-D1-1-like isoform X2 [Ipomoea batatas]